jgi:hypothetical protein
MPRSADEYIRRLQRAVRILYSPLITESRNKKTHYIGYDSAGYEMRKESALEGRMAMQNDKDVSAPQQLSHILCGSVAREGVLSLGKMTMPMAARQEGILVLSLVPLL